MAFKIHFLTCTRLISHAHQPHTAIVTLYMAQRELCQHGGKFQGTVLSRSYRAGWRWRKRSGGRLTGHWGWEAGWVEARRELASAVQELSSFLSSGKPQLIRACNTKHRDTRMALSPPHMKGCCPDASNTAARDLNVTEVRNWKEISPKFLPLSPSPLFYQLEVITGISRTWVLWAEEKAKGKVGNPCCLPLGGRGSQAGLGSQPGLTPQGPPRHAVGPRLGTALAPGAPMFCVRAEPYFPLPSFHENLRDWEARKARMGFFTAVLGTILKSPPNRTNLNQAYGWVPSSLWAQMAACADLCLKTDTGPEISVYISVFSGAPSGSEVKNPPTNAGDAGLIPGEWNVNPLQYF